MCLNPSRNSPHRQIARSCGVLLPYGFSLIELIVFIVIISIAGVTLVTSFANSMPRGMTAQQVTTATQLAQERLELIIAQKLVAGFSNMTDPCLSGAPTACTAVSGYTVSVTGVPAAIACPVAIDNNTATCRSISVSVTDVRSNQLISLTTLVTNYEQ